MVREWPGRLPGRSGGGPARRTAAHPARVVPHSMPQAPVKTTVFTFAPHQYTANLFARMFQ